MPRRERVGMHTLDRYQRPDAARRSQNEAILVCGHTTRSLRETHLPSYQGAVFITRPRARRAESSRLSSFITCFLFHEQLPATRKHIKLRASLS